MSNQPSLIELLATYPVATALLIVFILSVADATAGWIKEKVPFLIVRRLMTPWRRYLFELLYLRFVIAEGKKRGWNNSQQWVALQTLRVRATSTDSSKNLGLTNTIESCLRDGLQVVIVGESGCGKTFALRAFMYRLAEQAYRKNIRFWASLFAVVVVFMTLPILPWVGLGILAFVPVWERMIRRWPLPVLLEGNAYGDDGKPQPFEQFLRSSLAMTSEGQVLAEDIRHFVDTQRLAIFWDGLNEIDSSLYPQAIDILSKELGVPLGEYRRVPLIITSRQETQIAERPHLSRLNLDIFVLPELDDKGVRVFLETYGVTQVDSVFRSLQDGGFLREGGLARNLFWLEKIARTNIHSGNAGEILHRFVTDSIERERRNPAKAYHRSIVELTAEQDALAHIATQMILSGKYKYKRTEAEKLLIEWLTNHKSKFVPTDILEEAEGAFLIEAIKDFRPHIAFRHEWLRYYFAAWAIGIDEVDVLDKSTERPWGRALWLFGGMTDEYDELIHALISDSSQADRVLIGLGLLFCGRPARQITSLYQDVFHALYEALYPLPNPLPRVAAWILAGDLVPNVRELMLDLCIEQLEHGEDTNVKRGAALALGVFRDQRAITPLIRAFTDIRLVEVIVEALACIGELAVPQLKVDAQRNKSPMLRRGALLTLARIQGAEAADMLISALDDVDHSVKLAARDALVTLGEDVTPRLGHFLTASDSSVNRKYWLIETIGEIKSTQAAQVMLGALADKESIVRQHATQKLGEMGTELIAPAYDGALNSEDKWIRYGAHLAMGYALVEKKTYDEALGYYHMAQSVIDIDTLLYHWRGEVYLWLGQYDSAIADALRGIQIDAHCLPCYDVRGRAYYYKGEYDNAIADYSFCISQNDNRETTYALRGDVYLAKQEYEKAIDDYSKAIQLNPKYTNAYFNRARANYKAKDYLNALEDFERAIELGDRRVIALDWLGNAYIGAGNIDKALSSYTQAIETDEKYPAAYCNRAMIFEQRGKFKEAILDYEVYLSLNPQNPYWETYAKEHIELLKTRIEDDEEVDCDVLG